MNIPDYTGYLHANFIKCQFAERMFFRTQPVDIDREIATLCRILRQFEIDAYDDDTRGCISFLHMTYIREIWVAESPNLHKDDNTEDIVMAVMEGVPKPDVVNYKEWTKLQNLNTALQYIIPYLSSSVTTSPRYITLATIMELHRCIGNKIIAKAGIMRDVDVGAAGTAVCYAPPATIAARLDALLKYINVSIDTSYTYGDIPTKIRMLIRLAAFFFAEFLKIHPFSNGNGRTARLVASLILAPICIVPISLFGNYTHETYLNVLAEAQWGDNFAPLATLFLVSTVRTARHVEYLLFDTGEDDAHTPCK